jgi:hypothetical protein
VRSCRDVPPELFCVVPRDLPEELRGALQEHMASHGVTVIVNRRNPRVRGPVEIPRKRALHLPRELPELPAQLADRAEEIQLVQRMPAPGLLHADEPLHEVIEAVREGDPVAGSELVWRVHARVHARLVHRHGRVVGEGKVDAALGRILDRIAEFGGVTEAEFLHWLDDVVDAV